MCAAKSEGSEPGDDAVKSDPPPEIDPSQVDVEDRSSGRGLVESKIAVAVVASTTKREKRRGFGGGGGF
ncbi:hypothetical protein TSUD_282950 [Trifolium subterraneum]|uniref:Uncharacterized protein n=1 Tax=Trifolium subterraneum TaxID=3900 RepID=A0A2Z6P2K5_TRISU|nr:hypothetical protein TSUD_282950 [Trifolium subterraneum]